ncbi:N-acetyltransferase family protein [Streptacidiphilus sp. EB129]|uniref:GNAT family N-acetyltransferase n=1 Tax=Streptacidiphilus sp. EB129 TaxID=3156262 RepID=UPI00351708D9
MSAAHPTQPAAPAPAAADPAAAAPTAPAPATAATAAAPTAVPAAPVAGLVIRRAEPQDGNALYALNHRSWSPIGDVQELSEPPTPDSTVFNERHLPGDYQLAVLDGALVGYIRLIPATPLPCSAHVRLIQGLTVDPSARRMGIARVLLDAAIAESRRIGARRVTLHVLGTNAPAQALYASAGFVVEGVAPEEFYLHGRYVDDISMGLAL